MASGGQTPTIPVPCTISVAVSTPDGKVYEWAESNGNLWKAKRDLLTGEWELFRQDGSQSVFQRLAEGTSWEALKDLLTIIEAAL